MRKFTKLMAALALLLFMTPAMVGWGQTSLATWTFTSTNYPSNKTNFYATGGPCTNSTFYLNGSGSTWNSNKGYAFTSVTDIDITLVLDRAVSSGETVSFSAVTFYNKASNAPMKGFNLTVKEGNGSYSTTGLSVTSWSLSTSATTYNVDYTIQSSLSSGSSIALKLTGTGSAGSGQGYMNDIAIVYTDGGTPTPTTYTVTYDANGGTGTMTDSNSPYNAGATVTVLDNAFTRDNYTFDHWNTSADDSGTSYDEGDTFTINANTTLYAQWTEQSSGDEQWVLTSLADLTSTDVFVIVGNNGSNYAMKNTGATSSGPAAIAVTVSGNKLTGTVSSDIKWNISGNATTGYVFYPNGSTTTWLYCNNDNNGLRIGNGNTDYNTFELKSDYIYNKGRGRYIGVYNSTNWRSYTSIGSNISGQTFAFYKKVTSGVTPPSISANNVSIAYGDTNGSISYTINDEPTPAGSLTAGVVSGNISNLSLGTPSNGTIAFTCDANATTTACTATVRLTYTYGDNETVTKDVTVTQAAVPMTYTTIPALFEAATSDETPVFVTFGNWVVSGVSTNGKNVFVTDNNGNGFVIYYNSDMSSTYAAGDNLSGTAVPCTLKKYNGFAELLNVTAADLTITSGGTVTVADVAMANLAGVNTGALVHYDNLTCSITTNSNNNTFYNLSDGTTTIQVYNSIYAGAFNALENGKTYNITGVYQQFNSTKEILPRSAADIVEVVTPIINAEDVSIASDATSGTIAYTITNEVSGGVLTASTTSNWLTLGTIGSTVPFTCSANDGAARTATVTLTYTYNTNETVTKDVTVTQAAYVAPPTAGDYVRITSLDQLTNGSKVVIAARYNSTANAYAAMPNVLAANTNHGKPAGVQFTSTTSGDYEVLPSAIVNEVNNYYWTVNIINNGEDYTFTNANGDIIACLQGESDFYLSTYYDYEWRIERSTASSQNNQAMVPGYTGFVITNRDVTNRAFAFNGEKFGDYHTNYTNTTGYNFFLDFFVQDEPQTYTKDITGWSAPGNNLNFYLIASPIGDVNPTAVTIEGDATATMVSGSFDLYYFDQAQANEWINYKPNTSGEGNASTNPGFNLERGTGYLYANQNTVTLEFTGTGSNSGEFPVELVYVSGAGIDLPGWNLLGNPFTENAYLVSNNSYRSFYTLDLNGNYISVTGNAVNAMEGIFVKADATGETVTFTTAPLPSSKNFKLALNLSNGHNLIDRAIVRFDGGDQLPKLQFREGSTKVYIPVEGQDYAVVSCEEMGELPVSFKAEENGNYNLSLSSEEVSFAYLHLIDNMTGADVDLLETPSYSFEAKMTDYANRFKLVFATGDNSNDDNFAFFSNGSFVINNEGAATLQVIDVTGRILSSESINGCTNVNVNAAAGVYMLRLINGDNVKVQKVVVK